LLGSLKFQMQTELDNASLIARDERGDLTEGAAPLPGIRVSEVRVIRKIKDLRAELHCNPLQRKIFQKRAVYAEETGPRAEGASSVTKRVWSRRGKGAGVEPLCQFLGAGAAPGDIGVSHYVGPHTVGEGAGVIYELKRTEWSSRVTFHNGADGPASYQSVEKPVGRVQKLSISNRQLIERAHDEPVTDVVPREPPIVP